MESERCLEGVRCVCRSGAQLEVVAEKFAICRVGAIVDDGLGTLYRRLAAEVGYTLFGDDDVD